MEIRRTEGDPERRRSGDKSLIGGPEARNPGPNFESPDRRISAREGTMAGDCVFCKILSGEIPSQKVYDDPRCFAILDINPVSWGHVLVLPKEHHETWTDLPPDLAADLARAAQKVAVAAKKAAGAEGFNLLMN